MRAFLFAHPFPPDGMPMSISTSTEADPVVPAAVAPSVPDSPRVGALARPLGVAGHARIWPFVIGLGLIHVLALLAVVPWLFSWTGVVLCLLGTVRVFGTLGINLAIHRLLTHRGFACPKWLEHTAAVLGVCCLQDTPARWVAIHRMHHQHSDEPPDPHSPLVSASSGATWAGSWSRTATYRLHRPVRALRPDLLRDRFYLKLERRRRLGVDQPRPVGCLLASAGCARGLCS